MISVFDYQQYREFLKDYYEDGKRRRTGLTYARFSAAAGLRSPNYLKLVMDGQKNLTSANVVKFAKGLKLGEYDSDYFETLVQFNQAKDAMEREFYQQRMKRLRKRSQGASLHERTLEEFEFESISNWLYYTVMVLTNIRGFRESPAWIRERLFGLVSESEISTILERLTQLRLIARSPQSGKLKQTQYQVRTKPELRRLGVRVFYEGMLTRAIQALKLTEPEEREFGAYVVGLSPSQLPELKRRVREFMKSLNEWALENEKPQQVYAFTFAGFPLTAAERRNYS